MESLRQQLTRKDYQVALWHVHDEEDYGGADDGNDGDDGDNQYLAQPERTIRWHAHVGTMTMMATDGDGDFYRGIGPNFDYDDGADNNDAEDNQYSIFYPADNLILSPADRDQTRSVELCTPFA